MPVLPRLTRSLLAGVAVVSLLAACGDDDDPKDDAESSESTDSGTDASSDVCERLPVDALNDATDEDFSKAEPIDDETCQYSNADSTARVQLSVKDLGEQTPEDFAAEGAAQCDEGTEVEVDIDGADVSLACVITGVPAVAGTADGEAALLLGVTLDESVSVEQVFTVLADLLADVLA